MLRFSSVFKMWHVIAHNINTLNAKLNPICHFLALSGAHPILHVSRIRVKPCLAHSACVLTHPVRGHITVRTDFTVLKEK
jgi:hypothetical protein